MPARAAEIMARQRVLAGTQYDVLKHPFSCERNNAGEYVPLHARRPSVRTGLCRQVVDDAVSLLFSEGHWPTIKGATPELEKALIALVAQTRLNAVMMEAATQGSAGSAAVRFRVFDGRPYFDVLTTEFLTPRWQAKRPDTLESVRERYKVDAAALIAAGYDVQADAGPHWFQRDWTDQEEIWFLPQRVRNPDGSKNTAPMQRDEGLTVVHGLGFVPIEWIRNLKPSGAGPDGDCTFEAGIDVVIEADYLMSQVGRALRYGSDPTLVLKNPGGGKNAAPVHQGGAGSALVLPPEADAKLLELNGTAAGAALKHFQQLRETALEVMHGNRSHGDNLSAAQSGRAMEMMCQGLIWLADRMRISYGEGALLGLLRMACAAATKVRGGLLIDGQAFQDLDATGLHLRWAPWFMPTFADMQTLAQAISALLPVGAVSRKAAVTALIPATGIQDVDEEMSLIESDIADTDKRAIALKAATTANEGGSA